MEAKKTMGMTTKQISPGQSHRLPSSDSPWLRLLPEDGWLTLALLVIVVFTTIASIQSVNWVEGLSLSILTTTTAFGLLFGYLAVQQGRLPSSLVDFLAIVVGVALAFQGTANTMFDGDRGQLWNHTSIWFERTILQHQSSNDNSVFLLFLAILSFLLAYISVWLVIRTRRPWLAALANGVVLLINLNQATTDKTIFFLVLFLLATLLLLVRFTLAENTRQWRARGLRFSPDLGWDFMQAGAIFAVIVLLLAYTLPAGNANASLLNYWTSPQNPWTQFEQRWQTIFNGVSGNGGSSGGISFFGTGLKLVGTVNLPNVVILHYTTSGDNADPTQYLITETFDTYDGTDQWSASQAQEQTNAPNTPLATSTDFSKTDTYKITMDRVPGGQRIFAPGDEAAAFGIPSQSFISTEAGTPVQWLAGSPQNPGDHYTAQGYVSAASQQQLQQIQYPGQMSAADRAQAFPDSLLQEYLDSTPQNQISPYVRQTALDATKGTTNMYDAATHLEDYLRTFHYSTQNPNPPAGQDSIAWFLQTKTGFCTFFASAMAIMGRSLGMPTRIALGFTAGNYDAQSHSYIVKGTQAHVWTQIYFGKYGWVNFEPTASFDKFTRTQGTLGGGTAPTSPSGASGQTHSTPPSSKNHDPGFNGSGGSQNMQSVPAPLIDAGLGLSLFIILALLCILLFAAWWRLLFRGLTPVTAVFARVTKLGAWAGAPPQRSQTPHEYAEQLARVLPAQRTALQRISDIYAVERYGRDAARAESSGELPRLYDQVRVSASRVIIWRLRHAPMIVLAVIRRFLRRSASRPKD